MAWALVLALWRTKWEWICHLLWGCRWSSPGSSRYFPRCFRRLKSRIGKDFLSAAGIDWCLGTGHFCMVVLSFPTIRFWVEGEWSWEHWANSLAHSLSQWGQLSSSLSVLAHFHFPAVSKILSHTHCFLYIFDLWKNQVTEPFHNQETVCTVLFLRH